MTDRPLPSPTPLKPRPRLFAALMLLMALWIAFLLILYFTTVYPKRNQGQPIAAITLPPHLSLSLVLQI